jgi:hypothetical protein
MRHASGDAFAATYAEARSKFLAAAKARGLAVESHVLPGHRGAQGEELASDVAVLGAQGAGRLVVFTSGTHGVEGFCGSGCQVALLHDDDFCAAVAKTGIGVLFYHAVNPHGFSHVRRVNEDNVDLNRNFRDFTQPIPRNDAYAEVHGFMLPTTWPPDEGARAALGAYVARRGAQALQAAVSGGQSDFPDGLFFAGTRATWSNRTVREVLRKHASKAKRLVWIDVHTALGPWGHGEKIYAGLDDPAMLARTRAIFGADVTSFYDGSSTSAKLTGLLFHAALDECPGAEYAGIGLEYGTLPVEAVFDALRADHWRALHPEAPAELRASIRRAMRAAFHDDSVEWQAMILGQARVAAVQALKGLG